MSIECTPRVNPNINYGLREIMCYCSFIDCSKCPTLVREVDSGIGCACVREGGICKIPILSSQFSCGPKTAL